MGDIFHPSGGMQHQLRHRYASAPYNNRTQYNDEEDGEFFTGEGYEEGYPDEHGLYTGAGFDDSGCEVPVMTGASALEKAARGVLRNKDPKHDKDRHSAMKVLAYRDLVAAFKWWMKTKKGAGAMGTIPYCNILKAVEEIREKYPADPTKADAIERSAFKVLDSFINDFQEGNQRSVRSFKYASHKLRDLEDIDTKSLKGDALKRFNSEKAAATAIIANLEIVMKEYVDVCKAISDLKIPNFEKGAGMTPKEFKDLLDAYKLVKQSNRKGRNGRGRGAGGGFSAQMARGNQGMIEAGDMHVPTSSQFAEGTRQMLQTGQDFCQCGPHAIPVPVYSGSDVFGREESVPVYSGSDVCRCEEPIPVYVGEDSGRMSAAGNNERVTSFMHAMRNRNGPMMHKGRRGNQNQQSNHHPQSNHHRDNNRPAGRNGGRVVAHVNNRGLHVKLKKGGIRKGRRSGSEFDDQQHGLEYPTSYGMCDGSSGHIF